MSEQLVKLTINGVDVEVPAGTNVIEAARKVEIDIPFFCYHPRLSLEAGANCRMCLVDVSMPRKNPDGTVTLAKMPKPQTACSLPVSEGMVVETQSEQVVKDRKGVLEFLLINHPLDCPICDRGGECPLQNNTLAYGPPTTRYIEEKRHFPKAYPLSEHVVFDRERCIHCARCTRFTSDISGDAQLDFLFRGSSMEVGTFAHTQFQSRFSGNVIELCPVGALLSRSYRFKARPWDLMTQKSVCTQCSNGCNIKIDYRLDKLQRVNARINEGVNEEWTCDKGKFGMGWVSADNRFRTPMLRRDGELRPISWEEANTLLVSKLKEAGANLGGIGGAHSPNEDLYLWQKLFRNTLGVSNLDHRMGPNFGPFGNALMQRFGHTGLKNPIADLENRKTILVFGSNLVDEQPILFLRVRKAWRFKGASIVEAVPSTLPSEGMTNHVGEFASVSLRYKPGTELPLIAGLLHILFAEGHLSDLMLGGLKNLSALKSSVAEWTAERTAEACGLTTDALKRAARLLCSDQLAIIAGSVVEHHPDMAAVLSALGNLSLVTGSSGDVSLPARANNQQGAMDLGILPDAGPGYVPAERPGMNTQQMLEAAANGGMKMLWLQDCDLITEFHDRRLVEKALAKCPFTVAVAYAPNATTHAVDLVLPLQSAVERDGTFTNVERRVQRFWKCFEIDPQIHPGWMIFSDLGLRLGASSVYYSAKEVAVEIAATVPGYSGCTYECLGDGGHLAGAPTGKLPVADVEPMSVKVPVTSG
jgi:NADH-quinone oxidoreductase subunit G